MEEKRFFLIYSNLKAETATILILEMDKSK